MKQHILSSHLGDVNPVNIVGVSAPTDKAAFNQQAHDRADIAKGQAVAELLIKGVQEQAGKLRRFLMDLVDLSQAGRSGFRVAVNQHLKEIRKHVNAVKGTPEHAAYAAAGRSAGTRLSEAITFSKAVDAGFSPEWERMPYHAMIGAARIVLASESAVGPTQRRGRKAIPNVDKLVAFAIKLGCSPDDLKAAADKLPG